MDLKRNFMSNYQHSQNIKNSPLMQPLISISKASTPIRTRVLTTNENNAQFNSSPININKIGGF